MGWTADWSSLTPERKASRSIHLPLTIMLDRARRLHAFKLRIVPWLHNCFFVFVFARTGIKHKHIVLWNALCRSRLIRIILLMQNVSSCVLNHRSANVIVLESPRVASFQAFNGRVFVCVCVCVRCSDSSRLDGSGSYDVAPHSQEVLVFLLFSGELLWRGDA